MIFETSQIVAMGLLGFVAGATVILGVVIMLGTREEEKRIKEEVLKANKRLNDQISAGQRIG